MAMARSKGMEIMLECPLAGTGARQPPLRL
jgi:hypothetical protein